MDKGSFAGDGEPSDQLFSGMRFQQIADWHVGNPGAFTPDILQLAPQTFFGTGILPNRPFIHTGQQQVVVTKHVVQNGVPTEFQGLSTMPLFDPNSAPIKGRV